MKSITTIKFCIAVLLTFSIFDSASAQSKDWPRWGGPNGDLTSKETQWNPNWNKNNVKKVWAAKIGTGYSSVSIANNRLLTMGRNDQNQDVIYCLDAQSGKELWRHEYDCELFDNLHDGGPGSTPTIDGEFVYTLSRVGHIFCLKLSDGKVQWSRRLDKDVDISAPEWGYTSSATTVGDLVLFEAGCLIGYHKDSGEIAWKSAKKQRPGYGTPVLFEKDGRARIATLNNDQVLIADAQSGKKIATYPWRTSYATSSTSPIVLDDQLFVSTGYKQGCVLLKFDGTDLEKVYSNKKMSNHMNNCVVKDGYLYGVDGNSHTSRNCKIVCMKLSTGEVAWSQRKYRCGSLMLAGDRLIVLSENGDLACVQADPKEFKELGTTKVLGGKCWSVPVLLDGKVYCRNAAGDLVCVKLPQK